MTTYDVLFILGLLFAVIISVSVCSVCIVKMIHDIIYIIRDIKKLKTKNS